MSALEELAALAGPVAGAARSIMVLSQVAFAAALPAGVAVMVGVVRPGTARRVTGGE